MKSAHNSVPEILRSTGTFAPRPIGYYIRQQENSGSVELTCGKIRGLITRKLQLNKGVVLHFMRKALSDFPQNDPKSCSNLMTQSMVKLSDGGVIDKLPPDRPTYTAFRGLDRGNPLTILLAECYQQLLLRGYIIPRPDPTGDPVLDFN